MAADIPSDRGLIYDRLLPTLALLSDDALAFLGETAEMLLERHMLPDERLDERHQRPLTAALPSAARRRRKPGTR